MEYLETGLAIFGAVITCCSTIVALLPAAKEGSAYGKFVALLDKLSIFYAKFKK